MVANNGAYTIAKTQSTEKRNAMQRVKPINTYVRIITYMVMFISITAETRDIKPHLAFHKCRFDLIPGDCRRSLEVKPVELKNVSMYMNAEQSI